MPEVRSTWMRYHRRIIVPSGVYWIKNNLSVNASMEAAVVDSGIGGRDVATDDDVGVVVSILLTFSAE